MLDVRAESHLLFAFAVSVELMNVAFDGLEDESLAVGGPLRRAGRLLRFQLTMTASVCRKQEDCDVSQMTA